MKNIIIGIIHNVMNFMEVAVGSLDAAWFAVVILEYTHITTAISKANRDRWSPISGMRKPKSRMESYALRSSHHRNGC